MAISVHPSASTPSGVLVSRFLHRGTGARLRGRRYGRSVSTNPACRTAPPSPAPDDGSEQIRWQLGCCFYFLFLLYLCITPSLCIHYVYNQLVGMTLWNCCQLLYITRALYCHVTWESGR